MPVWFLIIIEIIKLLPTLFTIINDIIHWIHDSHNPALGKHHEAELAHIVQVWRATRDDNKLRGDLVELHERMAAERRKIGLSD